MPDQVRHDGNGLSSRCVHAEPALICSYSGSSRSAPIRDLVLALSKDGSSSLNALFRGGRTDNGGRLFQKWSLSRFFCVGMTGMDCHPAPSSRNVLIRDLRSYQTLDPKPHTRFFVSPSLLISCFRSSDQEPGRGASEPRTKLLALERSPALSKDGPMILDEGRGTAFQLLMLFSEDGGRTTVNVS